MGRAYGDAPFRQRHVRPQSGSASSGRAATRAGEWHYAIRYNEFMGVRSDFFLAEERGEAGAAIPAAAACPPE